jgi:predicted Fe-Mo cluster-binding NifX family protein
MKIAIPTQNSKVDDHFGHCEYFTVFTTDEKNQIISQEIVPSLQGCGCKSNIASILAEKGVSLMLAGGIGQGAVNVLANAGIEVIRGCSGDVAQLAREFSKGNVEDSGENCGHHDHHHADGHQCSH